MRWLPFLLLCCSSFISHAAGDLLRPYIFGADTLLVSTNWRETSPGARNGYLMVFTDVGNFEEDAGEAHERPYQYLMGRWRLDSATQVFTLSVDGQMGKTGVHSRYKRGRDFYLDYDLVLLNDTILELYDHLTGERRTFKAEARGAYVEPAMRRLPKPADKDLFKLPGGNWSGGFQAG